MSHLQEENQVKKRIITGNNNERIKEAAEGNDPLVDIKGEQRERSGYSEIVLSGIDECGCVGATAKGAVKTGIKVKMLGKCIGSRFPEKKVQNMRKQLAELGVEYL